MLALVASIAGLWPRPVSAEASTMPWESPTAIVTGIPDAARPALAYTADGVGYALWESEGQLYYARQLPNRAWSAPQQVAYGMSPALAIDSSGRLHALFANQFMGNYEIYQVTLIDGKWTLPVDISHTSGVSAYPVLAAGPGHTMFAAWMDNSPGYWTIYVGTWNGEYWSNQPLPDARGQAPTLAASTDGTVYLAWQDRIPTLDNPSGTFDIFLSEHGDADWSLPINISDSPAASSIGASLTTAPDGFAHLTWVDDDQEVQYCYGEGVYWPLPQTVVRTAMIARGPRIASEHGGVLHIAWDEGDVVRATLAAPAPPKWPKPVVVTALSGDLRQVSLAALPGGGVAVSWVQAFGPGDLGIYESQQAPASSWHLWLPLMTHP